MTEWIDYTLVFECGIHTSKQAIENMFDKDAKRAENFNVEIYDNGVLIEIIGELNNTSIDSAIDAGKRAFNKFGAPRSIATESFRINDHNAVALLCKDQHALQIAALEEMNSQIERMEVVKDNLLKGLCLSHFEDIYTFDLSDYI